MNTSNSKNARHLSRVSTVADPAPQNHSASSPVAPEINDSTVSPNHKSLRLFNPRILDRKFRAHSFFASLDPCQRATVFAWLRGNFTIEEVRAKIAAPPPEGLGQRVCHTTLSRLRSMFENNDASFAISESLDAAADILVSSPSSEVAPLREALSLMLYSRAVEAARNHAHVDQVDKFLNILTKIERLNPASPRRGSRSTPIQTRHHVELSITANPPPPHHQHPASIQITASPIPPAATQSGEDPRR